MKNIKICAFLIGVGMVLPLLSACGPLWEPSDTSASGSPAITKLTAVDPKMTTNTTIPQITTTTAPQTTSTTVPQTTTATIPQTSTTTAPQTTTATVPQTTTTTAPPKTTTTVPKTTTAPVNTEAPVPTVPAVDVTPPKVTGKDFTVTQGDSVSYKKQITVSDDFDKNPTIQVDNSAVDLDTPGVYPVVYTVTDSAGNSTVLTLMLTVVERGPDKAATEEYVLYQARQILDEIIDDSMSDLQVAYTIYRWTKRNIGYISTSDKSSWVVGAYNAFTKRQGDCFSYFSASKALLTAAGIENVDVYRPPSSVRKSSHYWSLVNVGDGWYHFDSTPFVFDNSNFFMLTDDEIHAWDKKYYKGEHDYDSEGLPEVATKSIQYMVNYSSSKLKE